jgi:membrane-associated protease RseP (regulator of RpoE activity)
MNFRSASCFSITIVLSLFPAARVGAQTQPGQNPVRALEPRLIGQHEKAVGKCVDCHTAQATNMAWFAGAYDLSLPNPQFVVQDQPHVLVQDQAWLANMFVNTADSRTAGLSLAPTDDSLRAHIKLPKEGGLVVTAIDPHSSAQQTGIQVNDILIKAGESPLTKSDDLEKALKSAGEKPVILHLLRVGKPAEIQVQPQFQVSFRPLPPKPAENQYWIGVTVTALEPALRSHLKIADGQGLIVNNISKDSPASRTDLKVNDILLEVDGKPLSHAANMYDIVKSHAEKPILFHVLRVGQLHLSIEVTPERRKPQKGAANTGPAILGDVLGFRYVQPGAVESGQTKSEPNLAVRYDTLWNAVNMSEINKSVQKQPPDAGAGINKRLDALDASIKQLREAIEELSKATKVKK